MITTAMPQPERLRAVHHALVGYASGDVRDRINELKKVHAELAELVEMEEAVARMRDRINRLRNPASVGDPKMTQIAADELLNHLYTLDEIRKPCRHKTIVRARWAVMKALADAGYTRHAIGNFLHCDHSSVTNALKRLQVKGVAP